MITMKHLIAKTIGLYLNVLSLFWPSKAGVRAFLLFCRPFRLSLSQKQLQFFDSAEKFVVTGDDYQVQVYKWGNGKKKILFLHGWQSHTYRWKAFVDGLSKEEYTIYSLDAPGHGLSAGNFLSVPLYSKVIENFIVAHGPFHATVGHSIGGFTLMYTLHRLPLLPVNKIVTMAAPGNANDFVAVFKNTIGLTDRALGLMIDEFVNRYGVTPDHFSSDRFSSSLHVKGLIIHDELDDEAPYAYSVRLHERWKKSALITTKGIGHNLRSPEMVKHVVSFVEDPVEHLLTQFFEFKHAQLEIR
jgi:pimeloyl-ACP methyl ester carboxylesterase